MGLRLHPNIPNFLDFLKKLGELLFFLFPLSPGITTHSHARAKQEYPENPQKSKARFPKSERVGLNNK